jgi:putative peptidoglycan lipid II flippase
MAYRMAADWRDSAVREVARLMGPRVLGLAAMQLNFYFVAIFFASTLGAGAISAMTFASLIVMTPLGIIGMSISTATFPTLAEQAARDERSFMPTLIGALRMILFLSLPAGVGLMLLAKPVVVVLLQRGAFDAVSTQLTAQAVVFYALGLVAFGGIEILSRGYYALSDTFTPLKIALGSMVVNLALSALLVDPLEVRGLALALSLSSTLEFLAQFFFLRRRFPQLGSERLLDGLMRMMLAALVMAATIAAALALMLSALSLNLDNTMDSLLVLVIGTLVGGAAYAIATIALGCEEPRRLILRIPRLPAAVATWAKLGA